VKTSIAIADISAAPEAFVVWRGFEESIKKAAALGYDGVELALKGADEIQPQWLSKYLKTYNLQVSAITTGRIFAEENLYMTTKDEEKKTRLLEEFFKLIKALSPFTDKINIGRCRGQIEPWDTRGETERRFVNTMGMICDYAKRYGMRILIEPVNRYECNFINTIAEASDLIGEIGRDNCGIHADLFHMNIEEKSMEESLIKYKRQIEYIHVADSNRYAPGMGHINFRKIFETIQKIGYTGWLSVEILPVLEPDEMARKSIEFLKNCQMEFQ
jgi:sugar phosphate isomerase/epimerase